MADKGNLGTSPYSKVVLDNTAEVAGDTPYQVSFVGDPQTGIFRKGTGSFGFGSSGVEVASVSASTFTVSGGFLAQSVATNLTATGTTIAGALGLTSSINFIGNVASGTGVILPLVATVGIGAQVTIFNDGANPLKVYGAGSDTVDGQVAATGVTLTNAKRAIFFAKAAATWISAQLGVVSA